MPPQATFPLYNELLRGRLAAILRGYQAENLSARGMARSLAKDHDVLVSHSTILRWLAELDGEDAA